LPANLLLDVLVEFLKPALLDHDFRGVDLGVVDDHRRSRVHHEEAVGIGGALHGGHLHVGQPQLGAVQLRSFFRFL
jgi:hypothetical protein